MKTEKFFALAKEKGISACEVVNSTEKSFSFSIFHGEVDSYQVNESSSIRARGIYKDKFGSALTELDDKETPEFLVNEIIETAKVVENDDPVFIFKGSEKYHKKTFYNSELEKVPADKKIALALEIEKKLKAYDKRIVEVPTVQYQESSSKKTLDNSYGLKLVSKGNDCVIFAEVLAKEGNDAKTYYDFFLGNDLKELNVDAFVKKVADGALKLLNGKEIPAKKYKAVLSQNVVASLLGVYLSHVSAEEVQKHTSLLEGKLNTQIASKKLTVLENPLTKNVFLRWFDDEGVATTNKKVIEKGVLKTYFYNLTTASKDGVTTTGNGYGSGSKIGISSVNITVKPGKKDLAALLEKCENGVYITSVTGLHSGMNASSGAFSLQATGFNVVNGKIESPLPLITVSGNLADIFNEIKEVGNDNQLSISLINCPSVLIKKIGVTC